MKQHLKTTAPIHDTVTGYDFRVDEPLGTRKAMRQKCLECCCGHDGDIRNCAIYDCTLWPWRFGRRLKAEEKVPAVESSE